VTRKLNMVLLLLVIVVGLPFGWLLLDSSTSSDATKPVTMARLRQLAGSIPGQAPVEVRYEVIGRRRVTSDLLAAGSGLRPVVFVIRAYELVLPQRHVITIDRGMSRSLAQAHSVGDFDPEAQAVLERAVAASQVALVLASDMHHSGRIAAPPELGSGLEPGLTETRAASPRSPYAVAPGVVVLPADEVAPGERMVYVRLADGQELLFAGDIARVGASWREQRPPARLFTTFLVNGEREEIAAWLRTVLALKSDAPELQIVAGHDSVLPRLLIHGFIADPVPSRPAQDKRLASQARIR
jgi:hypothetical protein